MLEQIIAGMSPDIADIFRRGGSRITATGFSVEQLREIYDGLIKLAEAVKNARPKSPERAALMEDFTLYKALYNLWLFQIADKFSQEKVRLLRMEFNGTGPTQEQI